VSALRDALLRAVDSSFDALSSLGTDVLFNSVSEAKFDFKKGAQRLVKQPGIVIRGFVRPCPMVTPDDADKVLAVFRASDVPSPTIYDTALFNGHEWTVLPEISNNGFTVTFKLRKGRRVAG